MRLALYEPDIPQNLGAFIRLAACLGAPLDIIEPAAFRSMTSGFAAAAMDYYDLARIVRHASWTAFQRDRGPGRLVLLTTAGAQCFPDVALRADRHLAARPRERGRAGRRPRCRRHPLAHSAAARLRSLNVALAAAMVLSEGLRQNQWISRVMNPPPRAVPARNAIGRTVRPRLPDEATVLAWKAEAQGWFEVLRDRCAPSSSVSKTSLPARTPT